MLSAAWCPFCIKMKKDVFPTTTVQASLKKWDLVYIDTDTYRMLMEPEAKNRSIPFYLMYDKNGKEVSRFTHEMNAEQFAAWTDDIYARIGEFEQIDSELKAKSRATSRCCGGAQDALIDLALKIQNVDARITVSMPAHLKAAMDAAKQAIAAGDTSADLKTKMRMMEIVQQYLGGDLPGASRRLTQFAQANANTPLRIGRLLLEGGVHDDEEQDAVITHDQESDKMFEDYLKKYPSGRYADSAGHRLETVIAAIEKVIKDAAKKAKEEKAKAAKAKLSQEKAAKKAAQAAKTEAKAAETSGSTTAKVSAKPVAN